MQNYVALFVPPTDTHLYAGILLYDFSQVQ